MSIAVGSVLEGVVSGITNFGAFIELPEGQVGLIHISEVADVYVKNVSDFLKEKDKVTVKVLSIDPKGKIGLSIKQLQIEAQAKAQPQEKQNQAPRNFSSEPRKFNNRPSFNSRPNTVTFEDKLSKFLKDSDERQSDIKRNTESKRGGGGRGGAGVKKAE